MPFDCRCQVLNTFLLVGHSVPLNSTLARVTSETDRNASHSLVPVLQHALRVAYVYEEVVH
jgi:hypothetical protein